MNKNKNSKTMLILSILLLLFIVIGAASAADDKLANETVSTTTNDDGVDTISHEGDNVDDGVSATDSLGSNDANSILKVENNNTNSKLNSIDSYSFNDFNKLIRSVDAGETIYLDKDVLYQTGDSNIVINKQITIDGQNKYIDFNGTPTKFQIDADNVILKNIHFKNTIQYYNFESSFQGNFLEWLGDNGKLSCSTFTHTTGIDVTSISVTLDTLSFNNITCNVKRENYPCFINAQFAEDVHILNSNFTNIKTDLCLIIGSTISSVENCKFDNLTMDYINQYMPLVRFKENSVLKDSNFTNIKLTNGGIYMASELLTELDNCKFDNITVTAGTYFLIRSESGFCNVHDCTFNNTNLRAFLCKDTVISYCNFTNFRNAIIVISGNDVVIDHSNFNNSNDNAIFAQNAEFINIHNCEFDNVPNGIVFSTNINKVKLDTLVFKDIRSSDIRIDNGLNVSMDVNFDSIDFNKSIGGQGTYNNKTFNTKFYVSVNGTGLGDSDKSPTNLTYAIENIFSKGEIIFLDGIYNISGSKTIASHISPLNPGHVIINNGSFNIAGMYNISDIIFNNTQQQFTIVSGINIINCTFTNTTRTITLFQGSGSVSRFKLVNCIFNKVNINKLLSNTIFTNIEFNKLTILHSSFNQHLAHASAGTYGFFNLYHINITSSKINKLVEYFNQISLNDFNLTDTNITTFFDKSSHINVTDVNIDGGYMGDSILLSASNGYVEDVIITGLNNPYNMSIFSIQKNSVLKGIVLADLDFNASIFSQCSGSIDDLRITNVNVTSAFNSVDSKSTFNKLIFKNSNFTEYIMTLNSGCILSDSTFNHVNGSVILNANDIHLTKVNFISCNSSIGNGTVFVNGSMNFIEFCNFTNNFASYNGGAIYINGTGNNIISSVFQGNNVSKGHGGAIFIIPNVTCFIDGASEDYLSTTDKINGLFDDGRIPNYHIVYVNTNYSHSEILNNGSLCNNLSDAFSKIDPNGIIIFTNASDVIFNFTPGQVLPKYNITIQGNNTRVNMSGFITISYYAYNTTIIDITFMNSPDHVFVWQGDNGKILNCNFINNGGDDSLYGSCIDVESSNLLIKGTSFINNTVGHSDAIGGGALYVNSTDLNIENCIFENNTAISGAHIYLSDDSGDVIIKGSSFIKGKSVTGSGGSAIVNNNKFSTLNISNSEFNFNSAVNGGAVYCIGRLIVAYSNFTNNTAVSGGAIYSRGQLSMDNVRFVNNSAVDGGAVYIFDGAVFDHVSFIENKASGHGGAIYLYGGKLNLASVNLTNNEGSEKCTVHVNSGASLIVSDNVLFLSKDASGTFNQYICGDYKLDVLYVSAYGTGSGWFSDDAAGLTTSTFKHLNDNGVVYFINGIYNIDNAVEISNLNNINFIGNGSTIIRNDKKSLFNNCLTHIKSCS